MADETDKRIAQAKKTSFRLLKIRARSEKELRARLTQKQFSNDIVNETINYLKANDLINDQKFARDWIESRLKKSFGLNRIRCELLEKGVGKEIIDRELTEIPGQYPEEKLIVHLANTQWQKYRNLDEETAKRRLFAYLIRRGYNSDTVEQTIQHL